jgi:[protein-PII] uridylyltransferase
MSSTAPSPLSADPPLAALKAARERLIADFFEGKAPDFLHEHAELLDAYFQESYEASDIGPRIGIDKNPYALIALGGYGRREQCIHSDVDLLFLFEDRVPDEAMMLVEEMVYPLWDVGLEVGHATRSVEDCISVAESEIEVLTALLDARFICGMSFLYSKLMDRFRERIVEAQGEAVIDRLIDRNQGRHDRFGDSTYLLEPNLKEGDGGLRDYHTVLWIARIKAGLTQPRDLEYMGCLSHEEYLTLTEALDFIWRVRNRLHSIVGRKWDQLRFRYQEQIADELGYRKADGQQPVERFLGELYRHMEFLKEQHDIRVYELETQARRRGRKRALNPAYEGLDVRNGMLFFTSSRMIRNHPELLTRIFEESARLRIPLSGEAKRLVREFRHLADAKYRGSPEVLAAFEKILQTPAQRFNALEAMLYTGMLAAMLPEFERIINRIQYDEYHLFPVDKHSLRVVQTLKTFGTDHDPTGRELCGKLYRNLKNPLPLLWAALLHDIGKGDPSGDHSESGEPLVRNLLKARGYGEEFAGTVAFLVRFHLLLVKTATRRDIQDEETAVICAEQVKDIRRLKMLYLLSVADSCATGPKAWNGWTASLLEGLYLNVLNVLEKGELATEEALERMEDKRVEVLARAETEEERSAVAALVAVMSPRYLLYTDPEAIVSHIRLYQSLGGKAVVWSVKEREGTETRTVTVCARDTPGLFSKIAGVFTLHGMEVLDAQVYTWRNNIALDVFELEPPVDRIYEERKWDRAEKDLQAALAGELNLAEALAVRLADYGDARPETTRHPSKIVVDNDSSSFFTIIEVFSYNTPGMLFGITDALFQCRLDVWIAKVATKVDQVVDVFYVRDFDGQKVDAPDQVDLIRDAIARVIREHAPDDPVR